MEHKDVKDRLDQDLWEDELDEFAKQMPWYFVESGQEVQKMQIDKAMVAGVRQHGSYKRYARSFHRDVLTVRGLAQRGKLSTNDSVLNFLARLGDNGVVWHVLEYWRATN